MPPAETDQLQDRTRAKLATADHVQHRSTPAFAGLAGGSREVSAPSRCGNKFAVKQNASRDHLEAVPTLRHAPEPDFTPPGAPVASPEGDTCPRPSSVASGSPDVLSAPQRD